MLRWEFWKRAYGGRLESRVYSDPEADQHTPTSFATLSDITIKLRLKMSAIETLCYKKEERRARSRQ